MMCLVKREWATKPKYKEETSPSATLITNPRHVRIDGVNTTIF
jgi:hypothetical protein